MIPPAIAAPLTAVLAALVLHAAPASAQILPEPEPQPSQGDADAAAAYMALSTTPVGALAPMSELRGVIGTAGGVQLHGQFGVVEQEGPFSTRNFALGFGIGGRSTSIRLTGGVADFVCDDDELFAGLDGITIDCGMGFFGGIDYTMPLIRPVLEASSGAGMSASLAVSLGASTNDVLEIDFEDPTDPFLNGSVDASATTYSAAVGIPLSFVVKSDDVVVVPHLTPRIGWGRATTKLDAEFGGQRETMETTDGGIRPMIGAGVDILFGRSGFGLGVGIQKIFAEDSDMTVGLNLSFRRR